MGSTKMSSDSTIIRNQHVLTSAAIKERVCKPWEAPSRPHTTARPQQSSSRETSRQSTRTWLFMGVEGENDSWREENVDFKWTVPPSKLPLPLHAKKVSQEFSLVFSESVHRVGKCCSCMPF